LAGAVFLQHSAKFVSSTFTQNVSADKHIFKVGLNYKFDWGKGPVVANY
jgi:hypothetical protein